VELGDKPCSGLAQHRLASQLEQPQVQQGAFERSRHSYVAEAYTDGTAWQRVDRHATWFRQRDPSPNDVQEFCLREIVSRVIGWLQWELKPVDEAVP
jgi:hypothetical protein